MQKANPVDGILHARDQSLIFLHAAFSLLQFVVYFQTKDFDIFFCLSFFIFSLKSTCLKCREAREKRVLKLYEDHARAGCLILDSDWLED